MGAASDKPACLPIPALPEPAAILRLPAQDRKTEAQAGETPVLERFQNARSIASTAPPARMVPGVCLCS